MAPRSIDGVVGWDIGGAHLKAAHVHAGGRIGAVIQLPCPLWQGLDRLRDAFDAACSRLGRARFHAITMTGELVDLFPDRERGVSQILDVVTERFPNERVAVFAGPLGFLTPEEARRRHEAVASANWRATADLLAGRLPDALLIDVGSTTTDLIALAGGSVAATGQTDAARLESGELLYFGVVRTPLMALSQTWSFDGRPTRICNELFATTADVYRLTGEIVESVDQQPAADGGPKTIEGSARRLARMIGRDLDSAPLSGWRALAGWLKSVHIDLTAEAASAIAANRRLTRQAPVVGAGAGAFLAQAVARRLDKPYVGFSDLLVPGSDAFAISTCAPAVAVGQLALGQAE